MQATEEKRRAPVLLPGEVSYISKLGWYEFRGRYSGKCQVLFKIKATNKTKTTN